MPKPAVAIRLGTEGGDRVRRDFADIGAAGEASAKRLGDAFDREAQRQERARQNMAATAAKIAAIAPQSAMQMRINDSVGTGYSQPEGSARRSAQAMAELIVAQEKLEARTHAFRMALDPAYVAQDRFNREMAEARGLIAAGSITLDEYCNKLKVERAVLDQATSAGQRHAATSGAQRAGMQQLTMQIGDMATMYSMGAKPQQIFASQLAQVIGAVQLMSGGTSKFATFMGGPWGAAITAGTLIMVPFITKLFETKDALDDVGKAAQSAMDKLYSSLSQADKFTDAATEGSQKIITGLAQVAAIDRGIAVIESHLANSPGKPLNGKFSVQLTEELEELRKGRATAVGNIERARRELDSLTGLRGVEAMQERNRQILDARPDSSRSNPSSNAAERAVRRNLEERAGIYSGFQDRYDPGAAIARKKAEDLAELDRIKGQIAADEFARFKEGIEGDARKSMFKLQFPDALSAEDRAKQVKRYQDGQADELAMLEEEGRLIGLNEAERERALSILRFKQQLQRDGIDLETDEGRQIVATQELLQKKGELIAASLRQYQEFQRIGENVIDTILNPDNWDDWGNLGKKVLKDLMKEMLLLAAINPLKNSLFGTNYPTLGGGMGVMPGESGGTPNSTWKRLLGGAISILGGLFGGGGRGFAAGTHYFAGGVAKVGEFGPENVLLPTGSRIMTAGETRRASGGGGPMVNLSISIDATGADAAGLSRVQQELQQLRAELPARILSIVNDGRDRGFIR